MAPHALTDLHDVSGYFPSTAHKAWSQPPAYPKNPKAPLIEPVLNAKIALGNLGFGSESPKNVWNLSSDEISEIEKNVRYFLSLNLPLSAINQTSFPLTSALTSKLRGIVGTVYGEQQFFILSGLDPYRYSDFQNVIIHAGLSSHVGSKRGMGGRTGRHNAVIQHITAMPVDRNAPVGQYHGPPSQNQDIPFHTDNGDIVSLFALSRSKSGGSFYLADSTAVYNELAAFHPELAQCLCRNWTMISPSPSGTFDTRPIAFPNHFPGRVLINCSRARITGTPSAPRPASLPALTSIQRRALDALHYTATKHATKIQLEPGDMVFFNNLSMMHARDAFVDNEAAGLKRHLLRLIIRNDEAAYELPEQLRDTWRDLYEHEVEEEEFPVQKELFAFACSH
ncbi:MAG: hypothetical protein ALECFALPRED_004054 [Alectoria fallacina]|uniref:TauD/TfdA-like domain-containing protein n=1 Tax=Alectoria fallacina TaxID=1903189 RepID=A0A8H3IPE0_9LECA|nr:MAG: hypothetical protein ALECFALPRED_004054 [Alectoria fallacina]